MLKNLNRKRSDKQKEILKKALLLRNSTGWTWRDISDEVGVHRDTIKNYRDKYGEDVKDLDFDVPLKETKEVKGNVLIVGDLHEPFCLDDYLDFCKHQYNKYKCDHVIFIGDVIDSHFSSYHEADPDGMTAGDELVLARKRLSRWHEVFPYADVVIGNHDRIVQRKAFSSGISKYWIKDFKDALGVPTWDFRERFVYNDVQYVHGEGGKARNRAKKDLMSTIQGHYHTECYTEHIVGSRYRIFSSQVGCGVDHKAYAMAYAKNFGKPAIGCMVVLDNGALPINILAELNEGNIVIKS